MKNLVFLKFQYLKYLNIGEVGTRDAFRYMGLVAIAGGIAYKIIHIIWLKKFDSVIFFLAFPSKMSLKTKQLII